MWALFSCLSASRCTHAHHQTSQKHELTMATHWPITRSPITPHPDGRWPSNLFGPFPTSLRLNRCVSSFSTTLVCTSAAIVHHDTLKIRFQQPGTSSLPHGQFISDSTETTSPCFRIITSSKWYILADKRRVFNAHKDIFSQIILLIISPLLDRPNTHNNQPSGKMDQ
jgi:hypothetical protein